MLEPYPNIQDRHSHGDVIVWPLKALCDYIEATERSRAFSTSRSPGGGDDDLARTERKTSVARSCGQAARDRARALHPGTQLIRYGEGDWNDSLQPADPKMRDWMVSSWTVALLYQQIDRYAEVLRRSATMPQAGELRRLAAAMRDDFNRHPHPRRHRCRLRHVRSGGASAELLLHPSDTPHRSRAIRSCR